MDAATQAAIDRLTADVAAEETVIDSFVAFAQGLADQLRANADSPAAINAIADKVEADSKKMADAIIANTPAST